MFEKNYFAQQGWECPKCGRVMSPSMMWCPWCCNQETTTTSSTTTLNLSDEASKFNRMVDIAEVE